MLSEYGKYYAKNKAGKLWIGNLAAAGVVLPIYSNTTQQWGLFNPAGSGVALTLATLQLTYVSTTGAAGGLVLAVKTGAGASIATGAVITAATLVAPISGRTGGGAPGGSKAIHMSAGIGVTAPTILKNLGINQTVLTAATTGSPQWLAKHDFDGEIIVDPGTAVFVAGNIATLSIFSGSISWIEDAIE